MNKVSIITVCYNSEKEIEQTILSVLSQSYSNIEYIIIDGNSSDKTVSIIKRYNNKINKWLSEPDRGIYDAMNKGIELCSGDWIIFMNAGDVFYDNHVLDNIFRSTFSDDVAIIYGDVELDLNSSGKIIRSLKSFNNQESVVTELCHQGLLTRANVLKALKYDLHFKIMADVNSFVQIYNKGYKLSYVPVIFSTVEATYGVSATNPCRLVAELCEIKKIKKTSLSYFKMYTKAVILKFMLSILPKDTYNAIRFRKVASNKEYK